MFKILIAFIKEIRTFLINKLGKYNVTLPYVIALVLALVFVVVGINVFIELTETLTTDVLVQYDTMVTDYIISFRSSALTNYFVFVTHVGDVYGYLTVLAISIFLSLVIFKRKKYVVQISVVLFLSALSNLVLKRFINRARPSIEHMVSVETLSYPSGHAMSAMAFYGFIIYLFYKFNMNGFIKFTAIFILSLLILSIGISRIYLGVHFPSDILGGFIAGAIWVVFCIVVFNMIEVFRRDPKT
ncbi:phosphatase PAP2 family protein [Hwangdonia lutea]|uniref:Phosphatase PAP2 family protein n=1 Tax=Hwangdonia lutea TaxID=3075823 RepID=A0AA97ELK5_9FLAO|nr:phosphatase PAP2 family protein [Hwangdonia sp. SCSIO 19198]WOD43482.1 phosphatase PAP2 family protein [Hwangdonia sp. SCSIO 19198]